MMEQTEIKAFDYFSIIRRRKKYIFIPFFFIFLIALIVVIALPSIYRTSCTILIEGQQIPADFIRSTVTSYAEQTIQILTQQITSRTRLIEIINQLNLYPDLRKRKTTEELIEKMRESIAINMISADIADQSTGRPTTVTIAFKLSFEGREPDKVQKVVNLLASMYLEENLKIRERKAGTTSAFLESELKTTNETISLLEKNIAQFKEKYLPLMPEMSQVNAQVVERIQRDLDNSARQIDSLKEREIYLQGQLSAIEPYLPGGFDGSGRAADFQQKLTLLYSEYITMKASFSEDHPDLKKIEKEIKSLEEEVGLQEKIIMKEQELQELREELIKKESLYSDQHVDIVRLNKAITYLEEDIAEMKKKASKVKEAKENPDNPAYINISTQIATLQMELEALTDEKKVLKETLAQYQKRLELAPQVEMQYKMLTRDYNNAFSRYQETMDKLMEAKTAETLEKEQIAEKFIIIDPAIYPEEPYKPNRLAIILIGSILALGISLGCAAIREFTDNTILSEAALFTLTNKPVLTIVASIENKRDRRKRRIKYLLIILSLLAAIALCALIIHLLFIRLDILWIKISRYIEQFISSLPRSE